MASLYDESIRMARNRFNLLNRMRMEDFKTFSDYMEMYNTLWDQGMDAMHFAHRVTEDLGDESDDESDTESLTDSDDDMESIASNGDSEDESDLEELTDSDDEDVKYIDLENDDESIASTCDYDSDASSRHAE